MRKALAIGITAAALLMAGCGSDSSSDDTADPRTDAAKAVVDAAEAQGFILDEACVNDLTAQLSDDDATKLAAGGGDADLSPEGEALGSKVIQCAAKDSLVELFISGLKGSGQNVDEDCAREKLQDVDIAQVVASTQSADASKDLIAALAPCFDFGSTTTSP
jgi:hypothetical protein